MRDAFPDGQLFVPARSTGAYPTPLDDGLAMALRSRGAFEPEARRIAYVRGPVTPPRLSAGRARALEVAGDGLARSVTGLAEDANVSPAVIRGS